MPYPVRPLDIQVWRMIAPAHQRSPLSGEGARLHGGRWNLKGWPAHYSALDPVTAVAEYYQGLARPGVLAPYRVVADRIADLTDGRGNAADPAVTKALDAEWKTIARINGRVPPSWAVVQPLVADGVQGALVPSLQNPGGTALVLWHWGNGGARLTLIDPDRALSG
ncbi:RES family NAD+ phosphorylase [Sphingomonas sp. IW22]|jgi:RES domain-containing protein|uniref:RES family NAD+ phosphorylase n=1 Tax=Sphingomonas sp. IW22 TaxID=3242489 RepID=UPI0035211BB1